MTESLSDLGPRLEALRDRAARIAARVQVWRNKLIGMINIGSTATIEEQFLQWELGNTEQHCADCLRLNGQVHTGPRWAAVIRPQDPQLACGGWNCDCRLTPAEGPEIGGF